MLAMPLASNSWAMPRSSPPFLLPVKPWHRITMGQCLGITSGVCRSATNLPWSPWIVTRSVRALQKLAVSRKAIERSTCFMFLLYCFPSQKYTKRTNLPKLSSLFSSFPVICLFSARGITKGRGKESGNAFSMNP